MFWSVLGGLAEKRPTPPSTNQWFAPAAWICVSVVLMGINSPHTLLRVSLAASKLASKPPGTVWSRASPHPQLATAHAGVTVAGHAATVHSDSAL